MGIEAAFLIGVLVGQWIFLLVLWRAVVKILRLLTYLEARANAQQPQSEQLADFLSAGTGEDANQYDI